MTPRSSGRPTRAQTREGEPERRSPNAGALELEDPAHDRDRAGVGAVDAEEAEALREERLPAGVGSVRRVVDDADVERRVRRQVDDLVARHALRVHELVDPREERTR